MARGLARPGGRVVLMIGAAQMDLAKTLAGKVSWQDPVLVPDSHSRVLLVGTTPRTVG